MEQLKYFFSMFKERNCFFGNINLESKYINIPKGVTYLSTDRAYVHQTNRAREL